MFSDRSPLSVRLPTFERPYLFLKVTAHTVTCVSLYVGSILRFVSALATNLDEIVHLKPF